jgi:hypothetical protein
MGIFRKKSGTATTRNEGLRKGKSRSEAGFSAVDCMRSTGQVVLASRWANCFRSNGVRSFRIPVTTL